MISLLLFLAPIQKCIIRLQDRSVQTGGASHNQDRLATAEIFRLWSNKNFVNLSFEIMYLQNGCEKEVQYLLT